MNDIKIFLKFLVATMIQLFGDEKAILTAVSEDREYDKSNNPTDKVLGTKYTVACPKRQYKTLTVKVPELVPVITQEALDNAEAPIWITFEGLAGRIYQMDGKLGITCKADKAVLVTGTKARG